MAQLKEYMTQDIVTSHEEENLQALAQKMANSEIGFLPIVENGNYVGVITDRDIVVKGLANNHTKAGDIMTTNIVTGSSDMDVDEAVKLMQKHSIYRLLIVDDNTIQGVVTLGDLGVENAEELIGNTVSEVSKGKENN
ncbi:MULTISPECIES: CBS domain-containing protein [Staphylococcus]|uniref:CBS domain-containing protein n=1 Tax=Staphylococcus cohnii TaxID=29382 RepID=A0ABT6J2T1_9STAP|nr:MULTISPECIES: CBS domain-containing protein [Staphylococcus]MBU8681479.1 CBS domain-containing protein [Staphylococcus saprophyticus]MDH5140540.1 CBS domain-containing protein [Staphylococcus cohnii]MDH5159066.1 CBS domain-containing protein [Staphylococcus cohnii]MDH5170124.1 CBS domain-containing protein [Staphylococcus cohnii]MDK9850170.1 CBS domain-containing protein [Staphylococcus equorum]